MDERTVIRERVRSTRLLVQVSSTLIANNFPSTDHLNTPRLVADATGTTVWRWDQQEPFGNNPADEDPDANSVAFDLPLRLPGQRYDKETGLHYNYFQDYDPSLGRYVESDSLGLWAGLNTYAYVFGNPLGYADPTGEFPPALAAIGVLATGAVGYFVVQGLVGVIGSPGICVPSKRNLEYAQAAFDTCERRRSRGDGCACDREWEQLRRASEDYRVSCVGGVTSSGAQTQRGGSKVPGMSSR